MVLHTFAKRGTPAVVLAILFLWDLEPSTGALVVDAFTAVVLVLGNLPIYYVGEISRMLGNR